MLTTNVYAQMKLCTKHYIAQCSSFHECKLPIKSRQHDTTCKKKKKKKKKNE